jgi:hypothetical protein
VCTIRAWAMLVWCLAYIDLWARRALENAEQKSFDGEGLAKGALSNEQHQVLHADESRYTSAMPS